jgi:hypothetical protein
MGISYQICQDVGCQLNSMARVHCQACLKTVGKVSKTEDMSNGALAKAIMSNSKTDPPVFILHGQVAVPEDGQGGESLMGIDVSYKANHYRIYLKMEKRAWRAFKIKSLPPMQYFDKVSREVATQIGRTTLLASTLSDQIAIEPAGDEEDNYANRPDNYANIPV